MEWIGRDQGFANPIEANVVQVFVEVLAVGFKRADDLVLSGIHVSGTGFVLRQVNQDFIGGSHVVALNTDIVQTGMIKHAMNVALIRRMGELHVNQSSAPEIDAQRDAMPEKH